MRCACTIQSSQNAKAIQLLLKFVREFRNRMIEPSLSHTRTYKQLNAKENK